MLYHLSFISKAIHYRKKKTDENGTLNKKPFQWGKWAHTKPARSKS